MTGSLDDVAVFSARHPSYYGERIEWKSRRGEFSISYSSVATGLSGGMVLCSGLRKVNAGRRDDFILLTEMATPIEKKWLYEVMPELCRTEKGDKPYYNSVSDQVEIKMQARSIDLIIEEIGILAQCDQDLASAAFTNWIAGYL